MHPDTNWKLTWLKIKVHSWSWKQQQNSLTTTFISSWCGAFDHIASYSSADGNLTWGLTFHQISVKSVAMNQTQTNGRTDGSLIGPEIQRSDLNHVRLEEKRKAESMYSERVFLGESVCVNWATNHMATGDGREEEVQQIIIISEHDAQIMGLLIDCADRTITETSNYHDMDLVMINDE